MGSFVDPCKQLNETLGFVVRNQAVIVLRSEP
jgi:hypothetical protein